MGIKPETIAKATAARIARSQAIAADLEPLIRELHGRGIMSLAGIARALNERGIPTPRGEGPWQARQVKRVLDRIG
jgi:hypothetical protein